MMKNAIGFYMQRKTTRTGSPIVGWHLPSYNDWYTLKLNLDPEGVGENNIAGGKMKETGFLHWSELNTGANNSSGFSAVGAGLRQGSFSGLKEHAWFHCSDSYTEDVCFMGGLLETNTSKLRGVASIILKNRGLSVRLIKDDDNDPGSIVDIDGNSYDTVKIGNQVWLKENLKVRHFNNGDVIPLITDESNWNSLTSPGMCFFNNNEALVREYGILYNWYTFANGL
jgi:uncharacterized protein (TIGR02145 family)